MTYFILVFLVFVANGPPVVAAKSFATIHECQVTEGSALTGAYNDDTVTGWLVVDDCRLMGGKATKG